LRQLDVSQIKVSRFLRLLVQGYLGILTWPTYCWKPEIPQRSKSSVYTNPLYLGSLDLINIEN